MLSAYQYILCIITIAHESNKHEKFPITMIKWLLIFDFVQLLNTTIISYLDRKHVLLASSERNKHVALIFIAK